MILEGFEDFEGFEGLEGCEGFEDEGWMLELSVRNRSTGDLRGTDRKMSKLDEVRLIFCYSSPTKIQGGKVSCLTKASSYACWPYS